MLEYYPLAARITNSRDLYRENKIKIPTPEFIVLYNGKKKFPDYKEMKLSDSFELKNDSCFLELVVKAYNINKGRNVEIANRSPVLNGYETFVAEVNENLGTMSLPAAIKAAIKSCVGKDILLSFLNDNGSEVENMLLTEWNMKDALVVAREEGEASGIEKGEAKTRELLALWESGVSLAEAKRKFGY